MNSKDLNEFVGWFEVNLQNKRSLLDKLPRKSGVYVFKYYQLFGRFVGQSDILYIGQTQELGLKERIDKYFSSDKTQRTNFKINQFLKKYASSGEVSLAYLLVPKQDCLKTETALKNQYREEHAELPPLNSH